MTQLTWHGPPPEVLPGIVPVSMVLGRSDRAAVGLAGMRAYPSGVVLGIELRGRGRRTRQFVDVLVAGKDSRRRDQRWRAEWLVWGIRLPGGHTVTNVDEYDWAGRPVDDPGGWQPDHPVLANMGGRGCADEVDLAYWLWPLPEPGPLRLFCRWPAEGIAPTEQDLDGRLLREAAGRARPYWEA